MVVGVPGVWSAQAGVGYNTGYGPGEGSVYGYVGATAAMNTVSASYSTSGGFSVGYSAGATVFSGLPISTNFASVGVNYNFSNSSFSGNLSAWQIDQNGVRFNPSFSMMVFPEETTNLVRGGKFINNDAMLKTFTDAKNYQGALEYFGFKGTYDPNNELFQGGNDPGAVDPYGTGDIYYNTTAFNGGFDKLYFVAEHERRHSFDVRSGKYENLVLTKQQLAGEEFNTWAYSYRRQGLYREHGYDIGIRLNSYGAVAGINPDIVFSYSFYRPWWHRIYRVPRRW